MADGTYISAAVTRINADDFTFQHAFGIGRHIITLLFIGGSRAGRGSRRSLFCIGLFGTNYRDIHYQPVRLLHFGIGTEGENTDIIDFLGLAEGHVQIGIAVFFRKSGKVNGSGVHVILGSHAAHGGLFQDYLEIFSCIINGRFCMDSLGKIHGNADKGRIPVVTGGPAEGRYLGVFGQGAGSGGQHKDCCENKK